ncbi:hypothetical protein J4H86_00940 [Spiractinospora alimapuensis]|uniref:hypothetical protein n=1 Tax=Spiractinospora alimapuensis TaxID=2820884 RepID=UPI001F3077D2|nr:hypothetical protein [Spiractinospora alimapuensis]QVQ52459.1 hypothetical protein J4H86_00940 [Spiractinospora alimapuensis]
MEFFTGGRGSLVAIDHGGYWQLAYTIPPGTYEEIRRAGLESLRTRIAALAPRIGGPEWERSTRGTGFIT